ncbi:MAG: hypothetical protein PHO15_01430 [Eubacteriales bacterium]|nr:hypothetical protein [Eubacteriales bacterium]
MHHTGSVFCIADSHLDGNMKENALNTPVFGSGISSEENITV